MRRESPATVRLQERDTWILESLSKMRFLTTTQLGRLYFGGSRWATNKRLRKLVDQGLIRVWVRNLSEENVYSLARPGVVLLTERGEGPGVSPRGLEGNLDHLLGINDVRIALVLGLSETEGEIGWWRSDWELRASFKERVIPDALFSIAQGGREQTFSLEVDNCTRSTRGFVKKILAYHSVRSRGLYGVRDFLTLVVGRDADWLARYRQALATTRLGEGLYFATLDAVNDKATASVWQPLYTEENLSLRDLITLPYGKEGEVPETIRNRKIFS